MYTYDNPFVTEDDLRAWEQRHQVRLPSTLSKAMAEQDGGQIRGTSIWIDPIDKFLPLSKHSWEGIEWYDGTELADRNDLDLDRLIEIGSDDCGGVILDFTIGSDPRVLFLGYELDAPRIIDPGGLSFDELVSQEKQNTPEGWEDD